MIVSPFPDDVGEGDDAEGVVVVPAVDGDEEAVAAAADEPYIVLLNGKKIREEEGKMGC